MCYTTKPWWNWDSWLGQWNQDDVTKPSAVLDSQVRRKTTEEEALQNLAPVPGKQWEYQMRLPNAVPGNDWSHIASEGEKTSTCCSGETVTVTTVTTIPGNKVKNNKDGEVDPCKTFSDIETSQIWEHIFHGVESLENSFSAKVNAPYEKWPALTSQIPKRHMWRHKRCSSHPVNFLEATHHLTNAPPQYTFGELCFCQKYHLQAGVIVSNVLNFLAICKASGTQLVLVFVPIWNWCSCICPNWATIVYVCCGSGYPDHQNNVQLAFSWANPGFSQDVIHCFKNKFTLVTSTRLALCQRNRSLHFSHHAFGPGMVNVCMHVIILNSQLCVRSKIARFHSVSIFCPQIFLSQTMQVWKGRGCSLSLATNWLFFVNTLLFYTRCGTSLFSVQTSDTHGDVLADTCGN